MKRWGRMLLLVLLTLPLAAPAIAGQEQQRQLAGELLELHNAREQVRQSAEAMKTMLLEQFDELDAPPEEQTEIQALKELTAALVDEEFSWDRLRPEYVELYANSFSEGELRAIVAFSTSPAGRKLQEQTPVLIAGSRAIGQNHAENLLPRVQRAIEDFLAPPDRQPDVPAPAEAPPTDK